jgi:hypothetical protein
MDLETTYKNNDQKKKPRLGWVKSLNLATAQVLMLKISKNLMLPNLKERAKKRNSKWL